MDYHSPAGNRWAVLLYGAGWHTPNLFAFEGWNEDSSITEGSYL